MRATFTGRCAAGAPAAPARRRGAAAAAASTQSAAPSAAAKRLLTGAPRAASRPGRGAAARPLPSGAGQLLDVAAGPHEPHRVAVALEPRVGARDVVRDDQVAALPAQLAPRRLHDVVALGGEADHHAASAVRADLLQDVGFGTSSRRSPAPSPRSSFLILRAAACAGRKSATAAAITTTLAAPSSACTAARISRALSTSTRRTFGGVGRALGAATSVTSAPAVPPRQRSRSPSCPRSGSRGPAPSRCAPGSRPP